jgi:ribosomal protein L11 methyltransferase
MAWLEVSLTVTGEIAEAVADVLARFAPGGVAAESASPALLDVEEETAIPAGPIVVRAYLPQDGELEEKRARLAEALWHLGQLAAQSGLTVPEPDFRHVAESDWAEKWKEHYKPMRLGRRLVVAPAWAAYQAAPGDVVVRLDPGMAFGTGTHPTTQLCLAAIEDYLRPGGAVLDLGTGSGILAVAAAKLGAASVLALDIDPEAVRAAQENAALNGVGGAVRVELGSLSPALFTTPSSLVICNILSSIIVRLLGEGLAQAVAPGGVLILSGILESQAGEIKQAALKAGLSVAEQRQMGEWVAIVAGRTAAWPS